MTPAPLASKIRGMPRELKVYGGRIYLPNLCHKGGRAVVAARTKKRVQEIAGITASEMRGYWSETGNEMELKVAMESPEKLIVFPNPYVDKGHYYIFDGYKEAYEFGRTP